jgi:hypothetical protein
MRIEKTAGRDCRTHAQTQDGSPHGFFFVFWSFLIKIREMNPAETYFQNLARCSRACPIDVTYEGVAPYALV